MLSIGKDKLIYLGLHDNTKIDANVKQYYLF